MEGILFLKSDNPETSSKQFYFKGIEFDAGIKIFINFGSAKCITNKKFFRSDCLELQSGQELYCREDSKPQGGGLHSVEVALITTDAEEFVDYDFVKKNVLFNVVTEN